MAFEKSIKLASGEILHIARLGGAYGENILANIYLKLWQEKRVHVIWQGGSPTLSWLLSWAAQESNVVLAAMVEKDGGLDPVGLGWIVQLTPIGKDDAGNDAFKAELGMGFLKVAEASGLPLEFAEMMLDYGFEQLGLVVGYGTTPVTNRQAIHFAHRLGMKKVGLAPLYGTWPDKDGVLHPVDCEINAITKSDWSKSNAAEPPPNTAIAVDPKPEEEEAVLLSAR